MDTSSFGNVKLRADELRDRMSPAQPAHSSTQARMGRPTRVLTWLSLIMSVALLSWAASPGLFGPGVFGRALYQGATVEVSLTDGAIAMPTTLPAGMTTFLITNNGSTGHNFEIGGAAIQLRLESNLLPGQSASLEVDLAPGQYFISCPVEGHAGQEALTLTVTEAGAAEEATAEPTEEATEEATAEATEAATEEGAEEATAAATEEATEEAAETTAEATEEPSEEATADATEEATEEATAEAAAEATAEPTEEATEGATAEATEEATEEPTAEATEEPTEEPTAEATEEPAEEAAVTLPGNPSIQLVKVADGLADPVNVAAPRDGSGRLLVVERVGRIRIVQDGEMLEEPFLDISELVKIDFQEQGLLGLALHPDYAANGRFFVFYTDWRTNGDVHLVEYSVSDDPNLADPESAKVLLTHDKPFVNHNGGTIAFGPDGYLYITIGDGGLAGDPYRNAQDISTLLGKLLRIDVDVDEGQLYRIPADNPFTGQVLPSNIANELGQNGGYLPDGRGEIWAYGLRNAWQFSFDSATGDLYIADVGQGLWEEVNFQPADSEGGVNYGWPWMEGSHCYPDGTECGVTGELPVAEYSHDDGSCSITGIGVYRGSVSTSLDGIYLNADYCSGKFWGLVRNDSDSDTWNYAELLDTELLVAGAGSDEAGELYVTTCTCDFDRSYDPEEELGGAVWRVVATDQVPEGSETAAVEAPAAAGGGAEGSDEEEEEADAGSGEVVQVSLVGGAIEMPDMLPAGPVTFEVTNDGSFTHNFEVEGEGIGEVLPQDLASGESDSLSFELPAGEYRVYCPVGNHAEQGMELTLTVE